MSEHDSHSGENHLSAYYKVFWTLILLVGVTIGASMVPLAHFAFPVAMAIATFKALLIILVFMHVKDEVPLVQVLAFAGFIWLIFLGVFLGADYGTRNVMHATYQPARSVTEGVALDQATEPGQDGSAEGSTSAGNVKH